MWIALGELRYLKFGRKRDIIFALFRLMKTRSFTKMTEASPMFSSLSHKAASRSILFPLIKKSHLVLSVDKIFVEHLSKTSLKSIRMEFFALKDLRAETKSVNVKFIVLETLKCLTTKENQKIFTFKIADETACCICLIRGEAGQLLKPGDIIRMTKSYAFVHKGRLSLSSGKSSKIQRMVR